MTRTSILLDVIVVTNPEGSYCTIHSMFTLKDDRQRFLQKVSKKQFRTVYYNANACGLHKWTNNIAKC